MTLVDKSLEQMLREIEFTHITRCDYEIIPNNSYACPIEGTILQASGGTAVVEEVSVQYICGLLDDAGFYYEMEMGDMDSHDLPLWRAIKEAIWGVYTPKYGIELPFTSIVRVGRHGSILTFKNEGDGFDYVEYISFMRKSIKEMGTDFFEAYSEDDRLMEVGYLDAADCEASYEGNGNTLHIMVTRFGPGCN